MPLMLDHMTTTVGTTPGFQWTTTMAPTESQDCIHGDETFTDGALIKTDKACEHCYCMKGDIVCVVQECGTPMENEGKNCTSMPPREGQCCPDTYICEGDNEITTDITTLIPTRRVGGEGSDYRSESDEHITEKPIIKPEEEVPEDITTKPISVIEEYSKTPEKEESEPTLVTNIPEYHEHSTELTEEKYDITTHSPGKETITLADSEQSESTPISHTDELQVDAITITPKPVEQGIEQYPITSEDRETDIKSSPRPEIPESFEQTTIFDSDIVEVSTSKPETVTPIEHTSIPIIDDENEVLDKDVPYGEAMSHVVPEKVPDEHTPVEETTEIVTEKDITDNELLTEKPTSIDKDTSVELEQEEPSKHTTTSVIIDEKEDTYETTSYPDKLRPSTQTTASHTSSEVEVTTSYSSKPSEYSTASITFPDKEEDTKSTPYSDEDNVFEDTTVPEIIPEKDVSDKTTSYPEYSSITPDKHTINEYTTSYDMISEKDISDEIVPKPDKTELSEDTTKSGIISENEENITLYPDEYIPSKVTTVPDIISEKEVGDTTTYIAEKLEPSEQTTTSSIVSEKDISYETTLYPSKYEPSEQITSSIAPMKDSDEPSSYTDKEKPSEQTASPDVIHVIDDSTTLYPDKMEPSEQSTHFNIPELDQRVEITSRPDKDEEYKHTTESGIVVEKDVEASPYPDTYEPSKHTTISENVPEIDATDKITSDSSVQQPTEYTTESYILPEKDISDETTSQSYTYTSSKQTTYADIIHPEEDSIVHEKDITSYPDKFESTTVPDMVKEKEIEVETTSSYVSKPSEQTIVPEIGDEVSTLTSLVSEKGTSDELITHPDQQEVSEYTTTSGIAIEKEESDKTPSSFEKEISEITTVSAISVEKEESDVNTEKYEPSEKPEKEDSDTTSYTEKYIPSEYNTESHIMPENVDDYESTSYSHKHQLNEYTTPSVIIPEKGERDEILSYSDKPSEQTTASDIVPEKEGSGEEPSEETTASAILPSKDETASYPDKYEPSEHTTTSAEKEESDEKPSYPEKYEPSKHATISDIIPDKDKNDITTTIPPQYDSSDLTTISDIVTKKVTSDEETTYSDRYEPSKYTTISSQISEVESSTPVSKVSEKDTTDVTVPSDQEKVSDGTVSEIISEKEISDKTTSHPVNEEPVERTTLATTPEKDVSSEIEIQPNQTGPSEHTTASDVSEKDESNQTPSDSDKYEPSEHITEIPEKDVSDETTILSEKFVPSEQTPASHVVTEEGVVDETTIHPEKHETSGQIMTSDFTKKEDAELSPHTEKYDPGELLTAADKDVSTGATSKDEISEITTVPGIIPVEKESDLHTNKYESSEKPEKEYSESTPYTDIYELSEHTMAPGIISSEKDIEKDSSYTDILNEYTTVSGVASEEDIDKYTTTKDQEIHGPSKDESSELTTLASVIPEKDVIVQTTLYPDQQIIKDETRDGTSATIDDKVIIDDSSSTSGEPLEHSTMSVMNEDNEIIAETSRPHKPLETETSTKYGIVDNTYTTITIDSKSTDSVDHIVTTPVQLIIDKDGKPTEEPEEGLNTVPIGLIEEGDLITTESPYIGKHTQSEPDSKLDMSDDDKATSVSTVHDAMTIITDQHDEDGTTEKIAATSESTGDYSSSETYTEKHPSETLDISTDDVISDKDVTTIKSLLDEDITAVYTKGPIDAESEDKQSTHIQLDLSSIVTSKPSEEIGTHYTETSLPEHDTVTHTTVVYDKFSESPDVNQEENEIGEEFIPPISSPGVIPGEGSCLVDGVTYGNNSIVPSTSKCQMACKCFSSIVKCDPIHCSPPPENMINCQPIYDSVESCCPTYICDHTKEPMKPQPDNQMAVTDTPVEETTKCYGSQCEIIEDHIVPVKQSDLCTTDSCVVQENVPEKSVTESVPMVPSDTTKEGDKYCDNGKCDSKTEPTLETEKPVIYTTTMQSSEKESIDHDFDTKKSEYSTELPISSEITESDIKIVSGQETEIPDIQKPEDNRGDIIIPEEITISPDSKSTVMVSLESKPTDSIDEVIEHATSTTMPHELFTEMDITTESPHSIVTTSSEDTMEIKDVDLEPKSTTIPHSQPVTEEEKTVTSSLEVTTEPNEIITVRDTESTILFTPKVKEQHPSEISSYDSEKQTTSTYETTTISQFDIHHKDGEKDITNIPLSTPSTDKMSEETTDISQKSTDKISETTLYPEEIEKHTHKPEAITIETISVTEGIIDSSTFKSISESTVAHVETTDLSTDKTKETSLDITTILPQEYGESTEKIADIDKETIDMHDVDLTTSNILDIEQSTMIPVSELDKEITSDEISTTKAMLESETEGSPPTKEGAVDDHTISPIVSEHPTSIKVPIDDNSALTTSSPAHGLDTTEYTESKLTTSADMIYHGDDSVTTLSSKLPDIDLSQEPEHKYPTETTEKQEMFTTVMTHEIDTQSMATEIPEKLDDEKLGFSTTLSSIESEEHTVSQEETKLTVLPQDKEQTDTRKTDMKETTVHTSTESIHSTTESSDKLKDHTVYETSEQTEEPSKETETSPVISDIIKEHEMTTKQQDFDITMHDIATDTYDTQKTTLLELQEKTTVIPDVDIQHTTAKPEYTHLPTTSIVQDVDTIQPEDGIQVTTQEPIVSESETTKQTEEEQYHITKGPDGIATESHVTTFVPPSFVSSEQPEEEKESSTFKQEASEIPISTHLPEVTEQTIITTSATIEKIDKSSTSLPPSKQDLDTISPDQETLKPEHITSTETLMSSTDSHKPDITEKPIVDDLPAPDEDSDHQTPDHFPPSGTSGYGPEPDYVEEDQAFGPGTCRYGGKVYVSAQQIPRDDPCDFCFCFRSDIICLQQSCPPPIHGCHEEPIQGFCCPRYECPVSMATTLNMTTTTTTTTTTLPPHFLPHAYKGAAQRKGCQIKGHSYQVGEVVRASSGPCLHCT